MTNDVCVFCPEQSGDGKKTIEWDGLSLMNHLMLLFLYRNPLSGSTGNTKKWDGHEDVVTSPQLKHGFLGLIECICMRDGIKYIVGEFKPLNNYMPMHIGFNHDISCYSVINYDLFHLQFMDYHG